MVCGRCSPGILLLVACAFGVATARAGDEPTALTLTVTGDVGPEIAPVVGRLTELFFLSYPELIRRFEYPDRPAPRRIRLVLDRNLKGPAHCSGSTVTVGAD